MLLRFRVYRTPKDYASILLTFIVGSFKVGVMAVINVQVPDALSDAVKAHSNKSGLKIKAIVEQALQAYLKDQPKPKRNAA